MIIYSKSITANHEMRGSRCDGGWLQEQPTGAGFIDAADLNCLHLVDEIDEAAAILLQHHHKLNGGGL